MRSMKHKITTAALILLGCFHYSSLIAQPHLTLLFPSKSKFVVGTSCASITGRFYAATVSTVQLLGKIQKKKYIEVTSKEQKESFAKEVRGLFPNNFILEHIVLKTSKVKVGENTKEYVFRREEDVDLRKFWASTIFKEILAQVYDTKVLSSELTLEGWLIRTLSVSDSTHKREFNDIFSFSVSLSPGINTFYLRAVGINGAMIASDSVAIFYKTEILHKDMPDGFIHEVFHADSVEQQCASCHSLQLPEELKKSKTTVEAQCKSCHNMLTSQKSSHYPAAEWDCLLCHDPSSSPKYRFYPDKKYDSSLCFDCHSDKRDDIAANKVSHAPAAAGECLTCHDPHGTRNESLTVAKVNDICRSCHEDAAKTPHPVVNHPIGGRPDPLHPGKEFSCVTCHNPHGSEYEYLLPVFKFALCQLCHKK